MKESRMPASDKRSSSKQKPSQKTSNVVISLFDPQLDHVKKEATRAEIAKSCSPILELPNIPGIPIASKYIIFVSQVDESAAERLRPWLEKRIAESIGKRVKNTTDKQRLRDMVSVEIIPTVFDNIWDLKKCRSNFGEVLKAKLDPNINSLFVNLASGTAAAKTALFLTVKRYVRDKNNIRVGIIQKNISFKNQDQSESNFVLEYDSNAFGLLAQGVATRNAGFILALNRLEQVIMTSNNERILITGPTGAGKSELAKLIMAYAQTLYSGITDENCIYQNVAAIAPTLIESELFGHEKGAFSGANEQHKGIFERANHGVVFLDEIGELPKHLQAKLLTVLDGVPFTRVGGTQLVHCSFLLICGTNVDLRKACDEKDFRRDLFERLQTWSIEVPALHNRLEDMEQALQRERGEWRSRTGREVFFETKEAKERFMELAREYSWPGNFREFHATFTHLAMFAEKTGITKDAIEMEFQEKTRQAKESCELTQDIKEEASSTSTEYDMAEIARLACALDVCQKSKTASEAGKMLFAARAKSAEINGTLFNGTSSLQRLFAQFGLKAMFRHGTFSVHPLKA